MALPNLLEMMGDFTHTRCGGRGREWGPSQEGSLLPSRGALSIPCPGTNSPPTWWLPLWMLEHFGVSGRDFEFQKPCLGPHAEEAKRELSGALRGGEGTLLPESQMARRRKAINKDIKKTAGQLAPGLQRKKKASRALSLVGPPEGTSGS